MNYLFITPSRDGKMLQDSELFKYYLTRTDFMYVNVRKLLMLLFICSYQTVHFICSYQTVHFYM